jgi:hypothetical protein
MSITSECLLLEIEQRCYANDAGFASADPFHVRTFYFNIPSGAANAYTYTGIAYRAGGVSIPKSQTV